MIDYDDYKSDSSVMVKLAALLVLGFGGLIASFIMGFGYIVIFVLWALVTTFFFVAYTLNEPEPTYHLPLYGHWTLFLGIPVVWLSGFSIFYSIFSEYDTVLLGFDEQSLILGFLILGCSLLVLAGIVTSLIFSITEQYLRTLLKIDTTKTWKIVYDAQKLMDKMVKRMLK